MTQETSQAVSAPSVLIADDQPAFLQLLRQLLNGVACEVIACADGAEAVLAFEARRPDWALLDWAMPKLDGLAAARAIRSRHAEARIILLSSHLTPVLAKEAQAAGVCGCFPKERLHEVIALLRAPLGQPTSSNNSTTQRTTLS